jgi:hypothetical protein
MGRREAATGLLVLLDALIFFFEKTLGCLDMSTNVGYTSEKLAPIFRLSHSGP